MNWFILFAALFFSTMTLAQEEVSTQTEEPTQESTTSASEEVAAPEEKPGGRVEKLEVTGSHIKRIDVEGPSPVLTIDQEDLVRSGYNSVSDVLRDAGVSQFGSFREQGGQTGAGTAAVDLRGLGQVRTLVLLNGQRLPTDAVGGSVDMNMIPMAAVDRIEVLKDGASAIYGSDALGGVVNIITKKEFDGHEIGGSVSATELGGGTRNDLSHTFGLNGSNYRFINILYFRQNERVLAKDREWSRYNISSVGSPGSYSLDGGSTWKPDPTCPANLVIADNNRCGYNFGDQKWEMPALKQMAWMSETQYDFTDSITGIMRLGYNYKEVDWQRAPAFTTNLTMTAPAELGADAGNPITLRYRFLELGNRRSKTKNHAGSALLGAKGYIGDTWDWQTNLSFNRVDRTEVRKGYALSADIQNALNTNAYNPFAVGYKGDLSAFLYDPRQTNISENTFYEFKATGELAEVGSGVLSLALGTQMTRELYQDSADDRTLNGEVLGIASTAGGGARNSVSLFTEAGLVFKQVETFGALRYDHYDGFGGTVNPKLSARYTPWDELMFRASAGTGFKAPQMQRLYAAQTAGFSQFKDHVHCNTVGGAACNPQQYPIVIGGNPNLKEETSFSVNAGTVFQPKKRQSLSFDWWYYDLKDVVEETDFTALTKAEADGANLADFGGSAQRDPVTNELIGFGLYAPYLNVASIETQGFDISYDGTYPTTWGDFRVRVEHTHMMYYKTENVPGSGVADRVGDFGRPQWRNNSTLFYLPNPRNEYSLLARTIAHNAKASASAGKHPTYTEFDIRYSLRIESWGGRLTAGIKNILGSVPPYDDSNPTDPDINFRLYDQRGRSIYVGYRQSF